METKRFSLRVVLTVVTGRLLTERKSPNDNGFYDYVDFLRWMTDEDEIFSHQAPRIGEECKPYLLQWFPELRHAISDLHVLDLELQKVEADNAVKIYLDWMRNERELLPFYDVPRIPKDDHTKKDPMQELEEMVGKDKIITIQR